MRNKYIVKNVFAIIVSLVAFIHSDVQAQSEGFILLKSNPSGAEVYIGGKRMDQPTPFQTKLLEGRYDFRLKMDLYHDYIGTFAIAEGKTTSLEIALTPAYGSVQIESEPSEAKIYLDGELLKKLTNTVIERIPSGDHVVKLEKDMYAASTINIKIEDGKLSEVFEELSPNYGTIGITSVPEAIVLIDGTEVATGNYFGRLGKGEHTLRLQRPGYKPDIRNVEILEGQELKLDFELTPLTGSLSVMCDPPESDINLDGDFKGKSPMIISDIMIGTHEIKLYKEGYKSISRKIEILENETTSVRETLIEGGVEIKITSSPSPAELFIDGEPRGSTPYTFITKPGNFNIRLQKKYFDDYIFNQRIYKDEVFNYRLNPSISTIIFSSTPTRANVSIDGKAVGTTTRAMNIQQGPAEVKMTKKGYQIAQASIDIDETIDDISFLLHPEKFREKGMAIIYSFLWPGAGQSYLNRGSWHLAMGAVGYGSLGGAYYMNYQASENYDLYLEETDASVREDLKEEWQSQKQVSKYMLIGAGVVWGSNLIWTLLSPSETKKYNKLKVNATYDNISKTPQVGLSIDF